MTSNKKVNIETKKSSPNTTSNSIDSSERLNFVVNKLYNNGNDNRSNKNGNPKTLIDKIEKTTSPVITCGLYVDIGKECSAYINDKSSRKSFNYVMLGKISKFILDEYKKNRSYHYIKFTEKGLSMLKTMASYESDRLEDGQRNSDILNDLPDDFRKSFKVECIFDFQERQKISPKEAR
jgi:hypothetical protein